jgi:hypothetical protein
MATKEQASFRLVRFERTPPDRLMLVGAWDGVDKSTLARVTLALHTVNGTERLEPVGNGVVQVENWWAVFSWRGDPRSVKRIELELGSTHVVDLPTFDTGRSRRRPAPQWRLMVREVEPEQSGRTGGGPQEGDVLALHAALVAAQDDAAEARHEHARLLADAESAREQAARERERRESDSARLHEAVETLRRLAEDSLRRERDATVDMCLQLEEMEASASALQGETARLREEAQAAAAARDEALEQLRLRQEEIEDARALLDEERQASAASAAALQELRVAHDGAREEAARARERLSSVEAELATARRAREEAEGLRGKLRALREVIHQAD